MSTNRLNKGVGSQVTRKNPYSRECANTLIAEVTRNVRSTIYDPKGSIQREGNIVYLNRGKNAQFFH